MNKFLEPVDKLLSIESEQSLNDLESKKDFLNEFKNFLRFSDDESNFIDRMKLKKLKNKIKNDHNTIFEDYKFNDFCQNTQDMKISTFKYFHDKNYLNKFYQYQINKNKIYSISNHDTNARHFVILNSKNSKNRKNLQLFEELLTNDSSKKNENFYLDSTNAATISPSCHQIYNTASNVNDTEYNNYDESKGKVNLNSINNSEECNTIDNNDISLDKKIIIKQPLKLKDFTIKTQESYDNHKKSFKSIINNIEKNPNFNKANNNKRKKLLNEDIINLGLINFEKTPFAKTNTNVVVKTINQNCEDSTKNNIIQSKVRCPYINSYDNIKSKINEPAKGKILPAKEKSIFSFIKITDEESNPKIEQKESKELKVHEDSQQDKYYTMKKKYFNHNKTKQ